MTSDSQTIQVVGAGRMGLAFAAALRAAGRDAPAPGPRGETGAGAGVVILAVPDAAIADAALAIEPGRIVGHLSGATSLEPLEPHERFSLHPLMTVAGIESQGDAFRGAFAAVSASSDRSRAVAEDLAVTLGMTPFYIDDEDRAAYHAAASIASNFLLTLEWFAEQLAESVGVQREALVPIVQATVANWSAVGPARALTGPIARGDRDTVAKHREAVAERVPEHLALFDELAAATTRLAAVQRGLTAEGSA